MRVKIIFIFLFKEAWALVEQEKCRSTWKEGGRKNTTILFVVFDL